MTDHFQELVNRGSEVTAATDRIGPDGQWTVGFGLVGLGLAIAIRAGIRAEVKRAQLPAPVLHPVVTPVEPSRRELIELHRQRLAELEAGEADDGES